MFGVLECFRTYMHFCVDLLNVLLEQVSNRLLAEQDREGELERRRIAPEDTVSFQHQQTQVRALVRSNWCGLSLHELLAMMEIRMDMSCLATIRCREAVPWRRVLSSATASASRNFMI